MIQENDEAILDVLRIALEEEGFQVIPIRQCDDAIIGEIDTFRPHMVMLDIWLREQDCLGLSPMIKARYPDLPLIALSCNINIQKVYGKEGFDAYIPKPFDLDLLYSVVHQHLPNGSKPIGKA